MANLSNYSVYYSVGQGSNWQDASSNNNIIYVGKGKGSDGNTYLYRSKIEVDMGGLNITSSKKLYIKIKVEQSSNQIYNYLRARLAETSLEADNIYNSSVSGPSDTLFQKTLLVSPAYVDNNGSSLIGTGYQAKGSYLYFVFDTSEIQIENKKYYLYLLREDTTSNHFNAFSVKEINLDYTTYTSCSSPTSIQASGIVAPYGTFSVSWAGAEPGAGQVISGYDIYYRVSKDGLSPTLTSYTGKVTISSNKTSGTAIVTINDATRGQKIKCGIVTKGSAGGEYYSDMATGGEVVVNSLPTAPNLITINPEIAPSTGGLINFQVSYDETSEQGQNNRIAYSSSLNGEKTMIEGSSVRLEVNSNKSTYYFWTYDGLEYSANYLAKTVEINSKPTCSITISGSPVASWWTNENQEAEYPYVISPELKVQNGENGQNNNKYTFWVQYSVDGTFDNINRKEVSSNINSLEYSISNIRNLLIEEITPPYYYRVMAKRNDGIEDSDIVYSNQKYYVCSAPNITEVFNHKDYTNITGLEDKFDKVLGFKFQYDISYSTFSLNGKTARLEHDSEKEETRGLIEDAGYTKTGYTDIQVSYDGKAKLTSNIIKSMYKIENISIDSLIIDDFNYWNKRGGNLSIRNPLQGKDLKNCGIASIEQCFNYGIKGYELKSVEPSNDSISTDTLIFTPNWGEILNEIEINTNVNNEYSIILQFINDFGNVVEKEGILKILCKATPEIGDFQLLSSDVFLIKQEQTLEFEISVSNCYNEGQEFLLYAVNENGQELLLGSQSFGSESNGLIEQIITIKIEEITEDWFFNSFAAKIINNANTSARKEIKGEFNLCKHTTPNVMLIRSDFQQNEDNEKIIVVQFNSNKWGLGDKLFNEGENTIKATLFKEGMQISNAIELGKEDNQGSFTLLSDSTFETENWEIANIYLKIEVTNKTNGFSTTYTQSETNSIIVYNLTPTVSYRKNYLGINTKAPESQTEAIIVIGNSSGRDKIIYQSGDNSRPVCILVNFKIDGGSW